MRERAREGRREQQGGRRKKGVRERGEGEEERKRKREREERGTDCTQVTHMIRRYKRFDVNNIINTRLHTINAEFLP